MEISGEHRAPEVMPKEKQLLLPNGQRTEWVSKSVLESVEENTENCNLLTVSVNVSLFNMFPILNRKS
jgi:hypothetical protein